MSLHDPLEKLGQAISDWWNGYSAWNVPAYDENGVGVCYANRSGAGPNDPHGDGGRAEEKANKQIEDLLNKLKNASGREAKKIKQKIKNLRKDAQKKKKGETHGRRAKGY